MSTFLKHGEHSSAGERRVYTAQVGGSNPSARTIIDFFKSADNYEYKIELALRTTLARVLDLFGKGELSELDKTQKTIMGSVFEDKVRRIFSLKNGSVLDFEIDGIEVDCKFSVKDSWMIPPECVGKFCILSSLNFEGGLALGVFQAKDKFLNGGKNRDKKRGISKKYFNEIKWIHKEGKDSAQYG